MAKITELPLAGPITGAETVPMVQGGDMVQGPIGDLVEQVAQPYVDQAEDFADEAGVQAGIVASAVGRQFAEEDGNGLHAIVTDQQLNVWLGIDTATGEPVGEMVDSLGRVGVTPIKFDAAYVPLTGTRTGAIAYGQSLSVDTDGNPALTTAAPAWADVKTFGSGTKAGKPGNAHGATLTAPGTTTTIPLICDGLDPTGGAAAHGENIIAGLYYAQELAVKEAGILPADFKLFGSAAGLGGQPLDALDYTGIISSSWWHQLEDHVSEAVARATAAGETYRLPAIFWNHGHADVTTAYATYKSALIQAIADVNTRVTALNPGNGPVHFLSGQLIQAGIRGNAIQIGTPQRVIADLDREHPLFHLVAPEHDLPITPNGSVYHLSNLGYWIAGRRYGRAFKQLVIEKRRPDAVVNIACWVQGTTAYALYRTPTRLTVDTALTYCYPITDHGFRWVDQVDPVINIEGTKLGISNLRIGPWKPDPVHGGTCLLSWTLDRAPTGTTRMRYGRDYGRYIVAPTDFNQAALGNLRDTTPGYFTLAVGSGSDGNYPAYHPMASDDRPVTVFS